MPRERPAGAGVAQPAFSDQPMHVLADRIETQVEVDRMHAPTLLRDVQQLGRLRGRHRQWLLADDVLVGGQRSACVLVMEVVG